MPKGVKVIAIIIISMIAMGYIARIAANGDGDRFDGTVYSLDADQAESSSSADVQVVKDNGMPNFEELFKAQSREEMDSMLSSLPRATGFGYRCSSESAAASFAYGTGAHYLEKGEWVIFPDGEKIDMYAVGPESDEEALELIALYTGATKVGVLEGEHYARFVAGEAYYGEAIFDASGDFISINLFKNTSGSAPDYYEDWYAENEAHVLEREFQPTS